MNSYCHKDIRLTSVEMGFLWNTYMIESMVHHILIYYLKHVEDRDVEQLLVVWLEETNDSLNLLKTLFQKEGFPVPVGITSEDIMPNAPRLFSDKYYILYSIHMGGFALQTYSLAFAQSSREDIRQFFKHYVDRLMIVNQRITDLSIAKGVYSRPPAIPIPTKVDFVKDKSFFTGFLGKRRPLTVLEITQLFYNAGANAVGKALITGFSQVTKSEEIRNYFIKGKSIAEKFIELLNKVLLSEDVSIVPSYDSEVMNTITSPFSDKLMLFHINLLNSGGLGSYGTAISASPRLDLALLWVRIMFQAGLYGKTGANLMVENGWMEQPPIASERNIQERYKKGGEIPQPAMKPMEGKNQNDRDE
jgi:Protein of unknown function (DUF3231)